MSFDPTSPAPTTNNGLLRVLFVDDEARIVRALKALFRDVEVYSTSDPREAPALAKQHDIDVIVCDQRMPEMLGVEVLREIKHGQPRAMRVLLTGYSDLKSVLGSVNDGEVYRFVNKPWVNNDLRQLVLDAGRIAREAPVDMTIDEVERIWKPIADNDDWSAFEAKLVDIATLREALALTP